MFEDDPLSDQNQHKSLPQMQNCKDKEILLYLKKFVKSKKQF